MLPTKQYFFISALVPASKLHPIMKLLGESSAYNVECKAYNPINENKPGTKRNLKEVKQKIINYLAKHGQSQASMVLQAVGEPKGFSILSRMVQAKLIKKGTKKGYYKP